MNTKQKLLPIEFEMLIMKQDKSEEEKQLLENWMSEVEIVWKEIKAPSPTD